MKNQSDSKTNVRDEAARLIDGAISLIEMNGWWNGQPVDTEKPHCAASSLDAAGVFFDPPAYQTAFAAVYAEVPEPFKMTYACYSDYMILTLFNDDHDKEFMLALMRRAAQKLRQGEDV